MKRILEPELMDTVEDARQYNQMNHADVNATFVGDLIRFGDQCQRNGYDGLSTDVLDVGTGTALIPIELCRRKSAVRVIAVDDAVSMLDLAVYNLESAGLRERVSLVKGDAKSLDFDEGFFDTTICNSLVHHSPDPEACFKEMHRVTASGGILFVRDLNRPANAEIARQWVGEVAGDESEYCQRLFLDSLHASLTVEEVQQIVSNLGYDTQSVTMTSNRHWTWAAVKFSDAD
jgi:SAM-dependent methyltransferase